MTQSELFKKVYHGEEGHLNMSFDDCKTIAKLLVDRGYAVMFTGGDLDNEYRIDWVYAGSVFNDNYAHRSEVAFGPSDAAQMLEYGEYEKDETEDT